MPRSRSTSMPNHLECPGHQQPFDRQHSCPFVSPFAAPFCACSWLQNFSFTSLFLVSDFFVTSACNRPGTAQATSSRHSARPSQRDMLIAHLINRGTKVRSEGFLWFFVPNLPSRIKLGDFGRLAAMPAKHSPPFDLTRSGHKKNTPPLLLVGGKGSACEGFNAVIKVQGGLKSGNTLENQVMPCEPSVVNATNWACRNGKGCIVWDCSVTNGRKGMERGTKMHVQNGGNRK